MKNDRLSNHITTYKRKLNESNNIINYVMDVNHHQNIRIARHAFGLVGGPIVNNSHSDIINMESQLFGIDNKIEYCLKKNTNVNPKNIQHLDTFQMLEYNEIQIKE